MRPHAELHGQLQPVKGKLKDMHSLQVSGAQKPCKLCAELGPFQGGLFLGIHADHPQTLLS